MDPIFPETLDPASIVFLNGRWTPLGEAQVSVLDRGFLLGDGIYEVVPVYQRRPFRWAEHYARMQRSLASLQIRPSLTAHDWAALIEQLISHQSFDDQLVYLQVTRGVAKRDHAFPAPGVPVTVFAMASPMRLPTEAERNRGISAITLADERWMRCDIKTIALVGNVLARQAAVSQGAQEAILFRDGLLTEGAACNVWLAIDGGLVGSRKTERVLQGIRYDLFEELCEEAEIPFSLRDVSREAFAQADEVMISSATKEILPVTTIDAKPVASGTPGPIYQRLRAAYDRRIASLLDQAATPLSP
jgi:D-alanine transaminase